MPNRKLEAFRVGKENDRRRKLSDKDRRDLLECKGLMSQREAAKAFGISRRLVQYTWFPEKLEAHREWSKGRWALYYAADKHREYMAGHRNYKRNLMENSNQDEQTAAGV